MHGAVDRKAGGIDQVVGRQDGAALALALCDSGLVVAVLEARSEPVGADPRGLELPADDPELLAGQMFRAENLWPDMAGFRATMLAYFHACHSLGRLLHRAFAIDLGLRQDFFEDKLDRLLRAGERPAAT